MTLRFKDLNSEDPFKLTLLVKYLLDRKNYDLADALAIRGADINF
jgi:hypothetical protein